MVLISFLGESPYDFPFFALFLPASSLSLLLGDRLPNRKVSFSRRSCSVSHSIYSARGEMTQIALAANEGESPRWHRIRGGRRRSLAKSPGVVLRRCTDASI